MGHGGRQKGYVGGSYLVPKRRSPARSEEHTSELQSRLHLVCRLLLEKKKSECWSILNAHSRWSWPKGSTLTPPSSASRCTFVNARWSASRTKVGISIQLPSGYSGPCN